MERKKKKKNICLFLFFLGIVLVCPYPLVFHVIVCAMKLLEIQYIENTKTNT